jgi:hypothetical protein
MVVMNKIYQAFDTIKLDERIKKKTYQKLEQQTKTRKYKGLIYGISLVMAVFIFFIAISTNKLPSKNNDDNINILNTPENMYDVIMYKGDNYLISYEIDINQIKFNRKIGVLKQVEIGSNLKNDFESYYHGGYEVYESNKDDVLIIKFNDDVLTYIRK